MDPEVYDEELVRAQIRACENARRLMSMPVDIDLHPLGTMINTRYSDIQSGHFRKRHKEWPLSPNSPSYDEALFIEKVDGEWSLPMSSPHAGIRLDIYPVALTTTEPK